MKAIVQDRYGSPDVLELRDVDKPVATDNELVYQELIEESGHSTVRILLHSLEVREHIGQLLLANGCLARVGLIEDHLAVDVPVEADYPALRLGLVALREAGLIGLHESAISLVHQGQPVGSAR